MRIPRFEAQTEWVKPTEFPDLRQVDEIAIDLETKDPDLIKRGSGSIVGNGEVIGIAVATSYYKGYFPIAHEGGGNMEKAKVLSWLKDVLEAPSTKIFLNAISGSSKGYKAKIHSKNNEKSHMVATITNNLPIASK